MMNIVGDQAGLMLWHMMENSDDQNENEYLNRLITAATKYGQAWFTDIITQKASCKVEPIWNILWDASKSEWVISRFYTPRGKDWFTDRMKANTNEVIELDINDLIID